ncbi:MAG: hypothetical protein ACPGFC_02275, partial [Paracoccaceae bacterium]
VHTNWIPATLETTVYYQTGTNRLPLGPYNQTFAVSHRTRWAGSAKEHLLTNENWKNTIQTELPNAANWNFVPDCHLAQTPAPLLNLI